MTGIESSETFLTLSVIQWDWGLGLKFTYGNIEYEIDDLKNTKRDQRVRKAYNKSLVKKSGCVGLFSKHCGKEIKAKQLCTSCYDKHYNTKLNNAFVEQITGIPNIKLSSLNPTIYSNSKCITQQCTSRTGTSHPYCSICLSSIHGLSVKLSNIEGIGLGLFAIKDFKSKHTFNLMDLIIYLKRNIRRSVPLKSQKIYLNWNI